MTRESRYGLRGVRLGEASNPGPPRTRARARLEEEAEAEAEAEAVLTGLEAAITRIADSSDEEPLSPTWRDEVSQCEEMGRGSDVRNVWARVGDVENHGTVAPTLLDSLAEDLCRVEPHNEPSRDTVPGDEGGQILDQFRCCADREVDECCSAGSESCWGEMENIGDDEAVEWGALPHPTSFPHAVPAHHVVECDMVAHRADHQGRPQVKRLRLIRHSQRETAAASSLSSRNRFVAVDDEFDSAADLILSHVGGAECRNQQGWWMWCTWALPGSLPA